MPALSRNGIRILDLWELEKPDLEWVEDYYRAEVRPVLTPLAIDPAHPFPQLLNKSLNLNRAARRCKGAARCHKHMGGGADTQNPATDGEIATGGWAPGLRVS